MWWISAAFAIGLCIHGVFLVKMVVRPFAPVKRPVLLALALLVLCVQIGLAIWALVLDLQDRQYQLAWVFILPAVLALSAVVQALTAFSLAKEHRGAGMVVAMWLSAMGAFGICGCYGLFLQLARGSG